MEPIEIDVLLNRPVPIKMRWEGDDIIGSAAGGTIDTIIFDADPKGSCVGKWLDIWVSGNEFRRKISAYDPATKTAKVDPPWSKVAPDGTFIQPTSGTTYAIEVTETFHLPRLGTEGLLPWLDEITEQRKANLRTTLIKPNMSKKDREDAEFSILQNSGSVVGDLNVPIQQPAGIRRVLNLSVAASDVPPDKRARVVDELMLAPNAYAFNLAQKLSTLFYTGERRPEPAKPVLPAGINPATQIPLPDGAADGATASPASVMTG